MTDLIQPFSNDEFDLAIEPHEADGFQVLAPGLARALGMRDSFRLMESIPESEKGYTTARTPGGAQRVGYLTEAGFYRALGQRQPARITDPTTRAQVERFQTWVYSDVLPSIRRHGLYATPSTVEAMLDDPDTVIELLTKIRDERTEKAVLAAKVAADAPKVLFADAVATSHTDILVRDLAKILRGNGVEVGGTRLFEWLRRDGFLIRAEGRDYNSPTQRAMEMGLFRVKETAITHSDGRVGVSKTPLVTGKGQAHFVNRYAARPLTAVSA